MSTSKKTKEQLQRELLELLEAKEKEVRYNKLAAFFPDDGPYRRELYPKHVQFMNAGKQFKQRAFIAGNRVGKSVCGIYSSPTTAHFTTLSFCITSGRVRDA